MNARKKYFRFSINFISDKEVADLYNRDNMTGVGNLLAKDIIAVLPGRTPLMDRQGMSFLKAFFSLIIQVISSNCLNPYIYLLTPSQS